MHQYLTIPRSMNFGHSHLDAWNSGFDDMASAYHAAHSAPAVHNARSAPSQPSSQSGLFSQRPLHTTQPLHTTGYQSSAQPNSWPSRFSSYDPPSMSQQYLGASYAQSPQFAHNVPSYTSQNTQALPSHSSYHPQRLVPPAPSPTAESKTQQRLTMAGSLDPSTGIFYRTPEHPRLRTAQACEKCRIRKAKCSGEHPSCKRCLTRGLACEYAKEGRVRGPNKPKKTARRNDSEDAEMTPSPVGQRPSSSQRESSSGSTPSPSTSSVQPPWTTRDPSSAAVNDDDVPADTSHRQRYRGRRSSLPTHRSQRPRPPDLSLDTGAGRLTLDSDGLDMPLSATSSGSHHRSGQSQSIPSSHLSFDYHSNIVDDGSAMQTYLYPDAKEELHANTSPHSAVSLTTFNADRSTPPHVFNNANTPPHSNYHYDLTPHSQPTMYRPSTSHEYSHSREGYQLYTSERNLSQALIDG